MGEALQEFASLTDQFHSIVAPIEEEMDGRTADIRMSTVNLGQIMDAHDFSNEDWGDIDGV